MLMPMKLTMTITITETAQLPQENTKNTKRNDALMRSK